MYDTIFKRDAYTSTIEHLRRTSLWLFTPRAGPDNRYMVRWIFLRALAAIYFSAFYSLLFQVKGLIGPFGILPAARYLDTAYQQAGAMAYWYVPTLYWFSAGSNAIMLLTWLGLAASVAAFLNLWPRLNFFVCFLCFLSFVAAAQDFSGYQSDGMLLEAGFLVLFFVPSGMKPGWGLKSPPIRASMFLLQWEWFRIYFESGMVKLLSGDRQWRTLTAMDQYYQNGPLPTWIGWYVEHLPHWFQTATAAGTLIMELGVVLMLFLPRRLRLICFCIVTPWEIGVILTANYTFLNYLVLALGFLLLDDRSIQWLLPARLRQTLVAQPPQPATDLPENIEAPEDIDDDSLFRWVRHLKVPALIFSGIMLTWVGYVTTAEMLLMPWSGLPLPMAPIRALEPFRIANQYGLFAVMTRGRYEIEFQGSYDGTNWKDYRFRYKPQALNEAPRIYAPYQPRFDWNLWFASLSDWQQNSIVPYTEERLLQNDPAVLELFQGNPFPTAPPVYIRAVLWQYWFTSMQEKETTGDWWKRSPVGLYAPVLERQPGGGFSVALWPDPLPPHN